MSNKTIGYIRVSTEKQDLQNQEHSILTYANAHTLTPVEFIEIKISTRKDEEDRKINDLIEQLKEGDTLIAADLFRLGRSVKGVVALIDKLIKNNINIHVIREGLLINPTNRNPFMDFQINIIMSFGQLERDLISSRTKDALASRKARGVKLGRKKGSGAPSKLQPYRKDILELLNTGGVSISSISSIVNAKMEKDEIKPASYQTLIAYINKDKELKKARENFNKKSLFAS